MEILPRTAADPDELEQLLDLCFGPGRQRRTASLLRRGAPLIPEASFIAMDDGCLVGSVESHRLVWQQGRTARPVALLGPLVSHPGRRGEQIGVKLMDKAMAALDQLGLPVMLIGDAPYYGRWGFSAAATGQWLLPGPVDRDRLLLRARDATLYAGHAVLLPPDQSCHAA
ncbi:GNAT family N-acetyltransferase [Sandaracinobacteroides sp. A072]|uniref:GNAT family N-acetyltransferase n=1 Tax=Sandaracinobacteroides sp. A072 TaxID=3461146 RepID=UPI004043944F